MTKLSRFLLLLVLLVVSACGKSGSDCVLAEDWGDRKSITVAVDPKNPWTEATLAVQKTRNIAKVQKALRDNENVARAGGIYIKVRGEVNLCQKEMTLGEGGVGDADLSVKIPYWQYSGQYVTDGQLLTVRVLKGGYFKDINDFPITGVTGRANKKAENHDGTGLYMYIGPPIDGIINDYGDFDTATLDIPLGGPAASRDAVVDWASRIKSAYQIMDHPRLWPSTIRKLKGAYYTDVNSGGAFPEHQNSLAYDIFAPNPKSYGEYTFHLGDYPQLRRGGTLRVVAPRSGYVYFRYARNTLASFVKITKDAAAITVSSGTNAYNTNHSTAITNISNAIKKDEAALIKEYEDAAVAACKDCDADKIKDEKKKAATQAKKDASKMLLGGYITSKNDLKPAPDSLKTLDTDGETVIKASDVDFSKIAAGETNAIDDYINKGQETLDLPNIGDKITDGKGDPPERISDKEKEAIGASCDNNTGNCTTDASKAKDFKWIKDNIGSFSPYILFNHPLIGNYRAPPLPDSSTTHVVNTSTYSTRTISDWYVMQSPWAGYYLWEDDCEDRCIGSRYHRFWKHGSRVCPKERELQEKYDKAEYEPNFKGATREVARCAETCVYRGPCGKIKESFPVYDAKGGGVKQWADGTSWHVRSGLDHWVGNRYDIEEEQKQEWPRSTQTHVQPNKGGYTLKVGLGCKGSNGDFLSAHMLHPEKDFQEKTQLVYFPHGCDPVKDNPPQKCPEGKENCRVCADGENPIADNCVEKTCVPRLDSKGQPVMDVVSTAPKPAVETRTETAIALGSSDPNANASYLDNGIYKGPIPATGEIWLHIDDTEYEDNSGMYYVDIEALKVDTGFGDFLQNIIDPLRHTFLGDPNDPHSLGIAGRMYHNLVGTGPGQAMVQIITWLIVLYMVVYGLMYMMGMIKEPGKEAMIGIIKVAFVATLISPGSWQFFNDHLFKLFTQGTDDLIYWVSGEINRGVFEEYIRDPITGEVRCAEAQNQPNAPCTEVSGGVDKNAFAFFSQTIERFLSSDTWIKTGAIVFSSGFGYGVIFAVVILVCFGVFMLAVIKAVLVYLMSFLAISLMIALAPIFIPFVLFERTRNLFEQWLKQLVNFAIQPVMMLMVLAIFNVFVYSAIYNLFNFTVCYDCIAEIDFKIFSFCVFHQYTDPNFMRGSSADLVGLLILLLMCYSIYMLIDWILTLTSHLITAIQTTALSKAVEPIGRAAMQQIFSAASMGASTVFGGAKKATALKDKKDDDKEDKAEGEEEGEEGEGEDGGESSEGEENR